MGHVEDWAKKQIAQMMQRVNDRKVGRLDDKARKQRASGADHGWTQRDCTERAIYVRRLREKWQRELEGASDVKVVARLRALIEAIYPLEKKWLDAAEEAARQRQGADGRAGHAQRRADKRRGRTWF